MEDAPERMNDLATCTPIDTNETRVCSSLDLRRDLIAMRVKHGTDTPIGHRCSNIVELLQGPAPAAALIKRQMTDLQQLLHAFQ